MLRFAQHDLKGWATEGGGQDHGDPPSGAVGAAVIRSRKGIRGWAIVSGVISMEDLRLVRRSLRIHFVVGWGASFGHMWYKVEGACVERPRRCPAGDEGMRALERVGRRDQCRPLSKFKTW